MQRMVQYFMNISCALLRTKGLNIWREGLKMRERRREDLARRRRRNADKEGMRENEGEMRKTKEGAKNTEGPRKGNNLYQRY